MSVLTSPRPTHGYVERNGPIPRRGGVRGNPPLQEVDGPLTGSGAVAIATDVGDTVLLDPASSVGTVGTVGTVTTVGTVGTITNPVTVDARVRVLGTPTLATGAAAGATVPLHTLPVDTSGTPNPRRNVSVQDASGNDLSTVSSGALRSLDISLHDGDGNRIGSSAVSDRGIRVYLVNQSGVADIPRFVVTDPGGSGSQASVLTVPGTAIPAGTKGMAIFDPHLGRLRGDTFNEYADVLQSRDEAPLSGLHPLLTTAVPARYASQISSVTVSAAGNTTVVSGVVGLTLHVRKISAALSAGAAAVGIGFRFGTGTLRWRRELRTNMQMELDFPPDRTWRGVAGESIECNLAGASSVEVTIQYDGRPSA